MCLVLLIWFTGPPVSPRPVRTFRTRLALGIVGAFLVRASDYTVADGYGLHTGCFQKIDDFLPDRLIGAEIAFDAVPAFQLIGLGIVTRERSDGDLGRDVPVRTVERDGGQGVTLEPPLHLARQTSLESLGHLRLTHFRVVHLLYT